TMTADRDWNKSQAHLYRAYLGQLPAGDDMTKMGLDKEKLDQKGPDGKPQPAIGTGQKDLPDVLNLKTFVDNKLGWDPAAKKPKKTYEDLLKEDRDRIEELVKSSNNLKTGKEMAEKRAKELADQLAEAQKNFEAALAKLNKKTGDDRAEDRKEIDRLLKEVARLGAEREDYQKKGAADRTALEKQLTRKNADIASQTKVIEQKTQELALLKQKGGDAPRNWRTDWKVVSVGPRGSTVYINLGSADHVEPQLPFTIHAVGPDGRPVPASKGTLE